LRLRYRIVSYYRLEAARMPWGDYGSILAGGMSMHLDRAGGHIQLERTGPFIPPITFPGIGDIIVTARLRDGLERSGLVGFGFAPVIKARIVELNWHRWDRAAPEPKVYPSDGEPESYILSRRHSRAMANMLGNLWELVLPIGGTVERHPESAAFGTEIRLKPSGGADIFRADGVGYDYVSESARAWLTKHAGEWVAFHDVVLA
jgi:hypothetical protein